jgi:hypothetical protein
MRLRRVLIAIFCLAAPLAPVTPASAGVLDVSCIPPSSWSRPRAGTRAVRRFSSWW